MLTFPSAPPPPPPRTTPVQGLGELQKSTFFFRGKNSTPDFFSPPIKSSAHASGAWRHSYPPIWDFYFDISEWHTLPAFSSTPALMLHLTNRCTKRKVLSLTKPKGKIYKTKSLGHYITLLLQTVLLLWFSYEQFLNRNDCSYVIWYSKLFWRLSDCINAINLGF